MPTPQHELAIQHMGRPLKFKTVKELEEKIEQYFTDCDERKQVIYNEKFGSTVTVTLPAPYGMAGLAYYLDIDRKTLVNYSHKEKYFPTIARARARVERDNEIRLMESRTPQGPMFGLKNNFSWVDESKSTLDAEFTNKTALSPEAVAILAKASRANDGVTDPE